MVVHPPVSSRDGTQLVSWFYADVRSITTASLALQAHCFTHMTCLVPVVQASRKSSQAPHATRVVRAVLSGCR